MLTFQQLVAEASSRVRRLGAAEAVAEQRACQGLMLDVREASEIEAKPNLAATPLPRGIVEPQIAKHCDDPDRPIFVHCAGGGRAVLVAEQLQRMGYRSVTAITAKVDDLIALIKATG